MAYLFKRPKSPYWWIGYREPATGKAIQKSTGFKIGVSQETRKAKAMRASLAEKEASAASVGPAHRWDSWVPTYIAVRYAAAERTREWIQMCWRFISDFLAEREVVGPQNLTRQHCLDYIPWRRQRDNQRGLNGVSHNTALKELRVLSVIMGEAVRRGMTQINCCRDLEIKKTTARPKPEMTDVEIAKIRAGIHNAPEEQRHFLRVSFEIAIAQGCRLSETLLDVRRDVDLDNLTIRFHAKGDQYYETALNPALVPLFRELQAAGRTMTWDPPRHRSLSSLHWTRFFRSIGLDHLCFHCTRVTVISRLERAGAPERVVMKLVNHSSAMVHRIYQRTHVHELHQVWAQAGKTAAPAVSSSEPQSSSSHSAVANEGRDGGSSGSRSRTEAQGASTSEPSSG